MSDISTDIYTSMYGEIAGRIIGMLERGVAPWRRPWRFLQPRNALTRRRYTGMNVFLLAATRFQDH
jgi:antirestriction protein ArdC